MVNDIIKASGLAVPETAIAGLYLPGQAGKCCSVRTAAQSQGLLQLLHIFQSQVPEGIDLAALPGPAGHRPPIHPGIHPGESGI